MIFIEMDHKGFIDNGIKNIREQVGSEKGLVALSGGVDSSVVAIMAHKALGDKLEAYFIDDYFRKKDEYEFVKRIFEGQGIDVRLCDIRNEMFKKLEGVSDNSIKRPLFKDVTFRALGKVYEEIGAKYFFLGTNKADKKMFEKGQDQHNVGVNFGDYGIENVIEPLEDLYKDQIRQVARELGLPKEISERQPFPGPGLLIRCLGEVTREKLDLIREGLAVAEEELSPYNPFQVVVAISDDLVCSMGARAIPDKYMLIVKAVKSKDAMTAKAIIPDRELKDALESRLMTMSSKIGRVLWDTTDKPPATIEYI